MLWTVDRLAEYIDKHEITLTLVAGTPSMRRPEHIEPWRWKNIGKIIVNNTAPETRAELFRQRARAPDPHRPFRELTPKEQRVALVAIMREQAAKYDGKLVGFSAYTRLTGYLPAHAVEFPADWTKAGIELRVWSSGPLVSMAWRSLPHHTFPAAWRTKGGWKVPSAIAHELPEGCVSPKDWTPPEVDKAAFWRKKWAERWSTRKDIIYRESMPPD